jgi:ferredoxin-NADP reductase
MCFIHLTDIEKNVTPGEVQEFQTLMNRPKWTKSARLRVALEQLCAQYESLWSAYDSNALTIDIDAIGANGRALCQALSADEASSLRGDLLEFMRKIRRFSRRARIASGARVQASAALEALFASPAFLDAVSDTASEALAPASARPGAIQPKRIGAAEESSVRPDGPTKIRCVSITPETHDVTTYIFVPDQPGHFNYKPGQFVTLELPIDGHVLRRSYTLSSSPTRPHALAITVKRVPKGRVSNFLHETMAVGFECMASGPHGALTCLDHPADKLLLISGGSGVTPMMSMLRFLTDLSTPADIIFINHVRTPADIIFEKELMYLSSRSGGALKLAIVPSSLPIGQAWPSLMGFWTEGALLALAPDFMARETFVAGPPGYVNIVRCTLERLGYAMDRYHEESFGPAPAAPLEAVEQPPSLRPATAQTVIVFQKSGATVSCADGDIILDVAEQNGLALDSSCRSGVCGICKVRKTEGIVRMEGQKILNDFDIENGYVLPCIGTAHGRVVIDA